MVIGRDDAAAALSFRNLPEVQLMTPGELNAYDVLCNDVHRVHPGRPADLRRLRLAQVHVGGRPRRAPAAAVQAVASAPAPAAEAADDEADDAGESWAGSAEPTADGSAPEGFEIKGNADSMLYHTPASRFYKQHGRRGLVRHRGQRRGRRLQQARLAAGSRRGRRE